MIDNGNHLVLSGNRAVARYLERIGARDALAGPAHARYLPFVDLQDGARWALRPNDGPLPWWMLVDGPPRAGHQRRATICAYARCCSPAATRRIGEMSRLPRARCGSG